MARRKVHGHINQWNHIMIISKAIKDITSKVCTDSFVAVNPHPCHHLSFFGWIKKIVLDVKTEEIEYFQNHEGSYYDDMPYFWKNTTVIK